MKLFPRSSLHYRLGCDVQQYNTEFHILHTYKHTHVCRERQFLLSKFVCRQFHTFSMHTKYGHFHFLPLFSVTCPTNLYLSSSYFCIFSFDQLRFSSTACIAMNYELSIGNRGLSSCDNGSPFSIVLSRQYLKDRKLAL